MRSKQLIFAAAIAAWVGCSPVLYVPGPTDTSSEVSLDMLREGRALYVRQCGSCHSLHLPGEFARNVWLTNLEEMSEKARISTLEKKLILDYLMHDPQHARKTQSQQNDSAGPAP